MTFLQPFVLWGLPLILLPIFIHLINRMRHRTQPWAAMRFLVAATRSSVSHAKLRQFLILLFRVLAVLMLVLFIGRPLAGGWLGWALSPAPDVILLLLDRSASMETMIAGTTTTRREQALKLLAQSAKPFEENSHLVLIDSALRAPQEIASADSLLGISSTAPTDTAADIPGMIQGALNWLLENRAGTAELWIASDLQKSNWQPTDSRWASLLAQIGSLPQKVRVRLLSFSQETQPNTALALKEALRRPGAQQVQLQFVLDLARSESSGTSVPLTINVDGARSLVELSMDGQSLRWRHKAEIGARQGGGWGSFEVPDDANLRDNASYFVYGAEKPLRATVVSRDAANSRFLKFAAAGFLNGVAEPAQAVSAADLEGRHLEGGTLLVWQENLPSGAIAERVRAFAEEGGVVIFFPPGQPGTQQFSGMAWGEVQAAKTEKDFRVARWEEQEGPLARTDEGLSLPLSQVGVQRRQLLTGQKNVLAAFDDGSPFVVRQSLGRGEILFCASLPEKEWSSLGEGPVLVPMMQRLMQAGSRRVMPENSLWCGELSAVDQARQWSPVDSTGRKDIRLRAGVYRSGERIVAVNRPPAEDEPDVVPLEEAQRLFSNLPFQMFMEKPSQADRLQGEIWRFLLFGMLVFLLAEGWLILPGRVTPANGGTHTANAVPRPARVQEPELTT